MQTDPIASSSGLGSGVGGRRPLQLGANPRGSAAGLCLELLHSAGTGTSSSELAGLSSHLEEFKSVCLGEGGPSREGVQKDDITLARPGFIWRGEKGWARLDQMGFPGTDVVGQRKEEVRRKTGIQGDVLGMSGV